MSGSTRGVRPTDLPALVSFDGRVFRNEAVTWDRLSRAHEPPSVVESALEGMLSFATGRHTWISVDGQRIRALVSGRKRGGQAVWEVDTLLATDEEPAMAPGLLQQLAEEARSSGAIRVLLRLAEGSPALPIAATAGFVAFRRERRYALRSPIPQVHAGRLQGVVRGRVDSDTQALFRLYNATVPAASRFHEAATLQEWRALRERAGSRRHREIVLEDEDGAPSAWLRVARDGGAVRLMPVLLATDRTVDLEALVLEALAPLVARRTPEVIVALVPDHLAGVEHALRGLGFEPEAEYVVLARKLASAAKLPARGRVFRGAARRAGASVRQALAAAIDGAGPR